MGRSEIWNKLCKIIFICSTFLLLDIANNQIHALSVDYSRHHCNHVHPKAEEASGIFNYFAKLFFPLIVSLKYFDHTRCRYCLSLSISSMYIREKKTIGEAILTRKELWGDYDIVRWWYIWANNSCIHNRFACASKQPKNMQESSRGVKKLCNSNSIIDRYTQI